MPIYPDGNHSIRRCHSASMLLASGMLLCSCMASGGGGSTADVSALVQMRADANRLLDRYDPIEYTDLSTVPTTGSATYSGFISGQLADTGDTVTDSLIGELLVEVDFGAVEMVSGSADNFLDDQSNPLTGSITLSGGTLDREGDPTVDATFQFTGQGELVDTHGQTLVLNTDFEGDFLADGQTGIGGDVLGRVTVDGDEQSFGGFFVSAQ
ncbi:hypothetical protein [Yoonia sp. 2307UL14-13]|uniref:hypothetical protein n=1 Tax=Yoonia sp. 2307UL14-13 TaxID=3126506 RepID=UPI0030A9F7B1